MPKSSKYSGSSYKPKTHGKSKTIRVGRHQFTTPAEEIAVVTHQTSHFDPVKGSSGEVTITTFTYKQHISRTAPPNNFQISGQIHLQSFRSRPQTDYLSMKDPSQASRSRIQNIEQQSNRYIQERPNMFHNSWHQQLRQR